MNEQLLKTSGAEVLSSRKNSEKPYVGSGIHHPPQLLVRPIFLISLLSIPCEILSFIGPRKK